MFLYYRNKENLHRVEVVKQTDHNYFIKYYKEGNVSKVSKKTMKVGDRWSRTYFEEETKELREEFTHQVRLRNSFLKLEAVYEKASNDIKTLEGLEILIKKLYEEIIE